MTTPNEGLVRQSVPPVVAHCGFSGRYPESTHGAYAAAIDYARRTGIELGVECDVRFTADDHLVCMHDRTIDRTSNAAGALDKWRLEDLRQLDFGSWFRPNPTPAEKAITTLAELLDMIEAARSRGIRVNVNVEIKHQTSRGYDLEERVAEMLIDRGWDQLGSPARMITFSLKGLIRIRELLPNLQRTYLMMDLGRVPSGEIPDGVTIVGPDVERLREDPGFVQRAHDRGNEVHAWMINTLEDVRFCQQVGVDGYTTDFPDIVVQAMAGGTCPSHLAGGESNALQ